jgi:hypothetical protein
MFPRLSPLPVNWVIAPNGATNISADTKIAVLKADYAGQIVNGGFVQIQTEIAASTTTYATVNILNGGATGTGATVMATVDVGKTATAAAFAISSLTLSATDANTKFAKDEYIIVQYDETGALELGPIEGQFSIVYGHQN